MNHLTLTASEVRAMTPKSKAQVAIEFIMTKIVNDARAGGLRHAFGTFDVDGMWHTDGKGNFVLTPMGDTVVQHLRDRGFAVTIHEGHYPVTEINWAKA